MTATLVPDLESALTRFGRNTSVRVDIGFGQRLRTAREQMGLSQRELAYMIGTNNAHISKLENGDILRPQSHTIYRLASALRVDAIWLRGYVMPEDFDGKQVAAMDDELEVASVAA